MASFFVEVVGSPYLNKFALFCMIKNGELFFYYLESLTILKLKTKRDFFYVSVSQFHYTTSLRWQYLYVTLNVNDEMLQF